MSHLEWCKNAKLTFISKQVHRWKWGRRQNDAALASTSTPQEMDNVLNHRSQCTGLYKTLFLKTM